MSCLQISSIAWQDLAEQLARPDCVLLTASNRQARFWKDAYSHLLNRHNSTWRTPTIDPYISWFERLFFDLSESIAAPSLLAKPQALWLWEQIIESSRFADEMVNTNATAKKAYDSFSTAVAWRLSPSHLPQETTDQQAFVEWWQAYQTQLSQHGWLDSSQTLDWLIEHHLQWDSLLDALPERIYLLGLLRITPQQEHFFEILKQRGVELNLWAPETSKKTTVSGVRAQDSNQEKHLISDWIKQQLTPTSDHQPLAKRIAVVVPNLEQERPLLVRHLKQQLQPESLTTSFAGDLCFNVSVGEPLTHFPMARHLISLIQLLSSGIDTQQWADLLSSQMVGLTKHFYNDPNQVAFDINAIPQTRWSWRNCRYDIERRASQERRQQLQVKLNELTDWVAGLPKTASADQWLTLLHQWLELWQWPNVSHLSSQEYQLKEQLLHHLASDVAFRQVTGQVSVEQQCTLWCRTLQQHTFQSKAKGEPVQILGLFEVIGLQFDAVWVCGLTDQILPEAINPSPFINFRLQRELALPNSSHQHELAFAEALFSAIQVTSSNLVVSYPSIEQDRELAPSPLIQKNGVVWQTLAPAVDTLASLDSPELLSWQDTVGTPLSDGPLQSGTEFFKSQAQCPMQAYLKFRLGLMPQASAMDGIDPLDRGVFVHQVMERIWRELGDQKTLCSFSPDALVQWLSELVQQQANEYFKKTNMLIELECEKTKRILLQWLNAEIARPSFEVIGVETKQEIEVAGLQLSTRIDRIDQQASGDWLVIDYKTGDVDPKSWLTQRIEEPQLPLYLLVAPKKISGLALAQLKAEKVKFAGITSGDTEAGKQLSKSRTMIAVDDWSAVTENINDSLQQIATEIKQGFAALAPSEVSNPCRYCEYSTVCRINEVRSHDLVEEDA